MAAVEMVGRAAVDAAPGVEDEKQDTSKGGAEDEKQDTSKGLNSESTTAGFWLQVYSWPGVLALVLGFGSMIVLLGSAQGLGAGRFDVRGYDCYDKRSYMKLDEEIVKDLPTCAVMSYPYRLRAPWWGSRMIVWSLYLIHQIGQWVILRQAQSAHWRGEIGWPAEVEGKGCPVQAGVNKYALRMFCLNMGVIVCKFIFSQIFYDGLANDVPEWSAQASVALWIFFSVIVRMPKRGLLFGYVRSFPFKEEVVPDMVQFVRTYHGYLFSFGTTYNFWYHPVEGSPGFVFGYLYQFCMILQSGFLFHPMHKNKWWQIILELGVIPHAVFIAIFFANGSQSSIFMFGYGFSLVGLITHIHGLGLSKPIRAAVAVGVIGSMPLAYLLVGRDLSNMHEPLRIAFCVVIPFIIWPLWVLFTLLLWPLRPLYRRYPSLLGMGWLLVWIGAIGFFIQQGPLNLETGMKSNAPTQQI